MDPVDRITAGAVGSPGERVFYIQGRKGDRLVTLLVEKQQVQLLAASVVEILSRVGKETGQGPPEEEMELDEPLAPEWRAGRLSIGYNEERDLLMLEAEELLESEPEEMEEGEEDEGEGAALGPDISVAGLEDLEADGDMEGEETPTEEDNDAVHNEAELAEVLERLEQAASPAALDPGRIRFWATREQMLSLARHGAVVCAAGRPRCQLCGNPLDPEGHQCPALNGHRKIGPE